MSHRYDTSLISGAYVYGVGSLGVLGSTIPSAGDSGAGYTYNDLSLPSDNAKEICGRVTTWPTNGTLVAYEDTSFEYVALSDGADLFAYQLYVDGVATGSPATVTLLVGSVPVTISCALGSATASGLPATLTQSATISAALGTATASGLPATLTQSATISAALGSATASGLPATLTQSATISAALGTATASGYVASISTGSFTGSISDTDIARIAAAVLAALNATTGTRTVGQHLQIQTAVLAGNETGAGTTHVTFTDGTAVVEADVPLPGAIGNRTNVTISV